MLWNRRESVTLYAFDLATCYEVLSGNTLSIRIGIGTFCLVGGVGGGTSPTF